jgi:predicted ATP-grasp superfamily ATP-dependent carboligase
VPAIVLASGLNGLGTVRSLGEAGVPVFAIVTDRTQPCVPSRFATPVVRLENESMLDLLGRLRRNHGLSGGVFIATSDDGARELGEVVPNLPPGFRFAGPPREIATMLMDKRTELEALSAIEAALPPSLTTVPASAAAILAALRLPIIFKPRTQQLADRVRMKNRVVGDASSLASFLREYEEKLDYFVAQEVVPGADDTIWQCNAVFDRSHVLVSAFTFQKLGMSPPHFGVTTMGRSVRNRSVIALSQRIGTALGYVGPAGFEFKFDARDRSYRYIEVNPRHGMSNWFDTACGVNSAFQTYLMALGDEDRAVREQQVGKVYVDLFADLASRLIDDREAWAAVAGRYFRLAGAALVPAIWMWRDPMPGLVALRRSTVWSANRLVNAVRRNGAASHRLRGSR